MAVSYKKWKEIFINQKTRTSKFLSRQVCLQLQGESYYSERRKELILYIIRFAKHFYGLTPIELRCIEFEFATVENIKHRFNSEIKLGGKDQLYLFLKRNPTTTLHQPGDTNINKISSCNREVLTLVLTDLEIVFSRYSVPLNQVCNAWCISYSKEAIQNMSKERRKKCVLPCLQREEKVLQSVLLLQLQNMFH